MASERGRCLPLSLPRRWMGDVLHFSDGVPLVAAERTLRVRALADARRGVERPPSWNAIIIRAVGLVSARVPALRRAYLPYPRPRLYEAAHSVASVVFDREFAGEPATFMVPLERPEDRPLGDIQACVEAWKTDPIERHGGLRRLVRYARMPRPIRRLIWSAGLQWSGYQRARHFGTFAVNSVASLRGRMLMFRIPITSAVYYGAVSRGTIDIQFVFDHRVFDGVVVGKASALLEDVLNAELVAEVRDGERQRRAAA